MGFGGISLWQLLIILLIVVLIFGTKRLRSIGSDLGGAVKSFRKSMDEGESEQERRQLSGDGGEKKDADFAERQSPEKDSSRQA
jgi:sec-independent protein translocase protein TatA